MRTALCLAAALVASTSCVSSFRQGGGPPDQYIEIVPKLVYPNVYSSWYVNHPGGWTDTKYWLKLTPIKQNPQDPPGVPPIWKLPTFGVDRPEATFYWNPGWGNTHKAIVNVREFIDAGDQSVVMRVDSSILSVGLTAPIEKITWESPNLGVVTRTYIRTPIVGDYQDDGDVDGHDFLAWQGRPWSSPDVIVWRDYLAQWQAAYGGTPPAAGAIPEPSGWVLALAGGLLLRRRRR